MILILVGLKSVGAREFEVSGIGVISSSVHVHGYNEWFNEIFTIFWRDGIAASSAIFNILAVMFYHASLAIAFRTSDYSSLSYIYFHQHVLLEGKL